MVQFHTTAFPSYGNLQGIRTDRSNGHLTFAGRIKGAKRGSENSLWLPAATAKAADCLQRAYFADARERFIDPARTFFGFSAGKRRVLLLGGREAVSEGGSKGLREVVREGGILLLPLKLLDFGGQRLPRIFNAHTHAYIHTHTHTHTHTHS